jgi:hypothetical protein
VASESAWPTFPVPSIPAPGVPGAPPAYPPSPRFDFAAGDFVVDGAGRVVRAEAHHAWVQWCVKAVLVERFAYPVYSPDYGAELLDAGQVDDEGARYAAMAKTITEALLVDPRTGGVSGFAFAPEGDGVTVTFTVTPTVGTPFPVSISLTAD